MTICSIPLTRQPAPDGLTYEVSLRGLKGGHSGMEINLGRANANQQLARFLWEADRRTPLELAEIDGGGLAIGIQRCAPCRIRCRGK